MEYKVLYRKYRPKSFSELVGQEYISNILKKAITNSKLSHAYLFTGPRGTGKTSTAKIFSMAVNCLNIRDGNPCGMCDSCIRFEENSDVIEIDAASNNGVDEIRELRNNVKVMPSFGKYKIYIIDEVHMLTASAFNALLKTLEEPPEHIIFILATTDAQKIPATVISRCQRFDFKKLSKKNISNKLEEICKAEGFDYDNEALNEIAFMADGAMRDALGFLDQIATVSDGVVKLNEIEEVYKTASKVMLDELYDALNSNNSYKIDDVLIMSENSGVDCEIFINKFIEYMKEKGIGIKQGLITSELDFTKIKDLIFELNHLLYETKTTVNLYTLLELTLLNYVETTNIETPIKEKSPEIIKLNEAIKESHKRDTLMSDLPANDEDVFLKNALIRTKNCMIEADKKTKNELKDKWLMFLEYNLTNNVKDYSLVIDTEVVAASNNILVIKTMTDSQAVLLNINCEKIAKTFSATCEKKYTIAAISDSDWENLKGQYKADLKSNRKWQFEEETKKTLKKPSKNNIEKIKEKVFSNIEVEIK